MPDEPLASEKSFQRLEGRVDEIGKKDKLALVISSLAFAVSVASFVVNLITNDRDAVYRELSFTPSLRSVFDLGDLSFGFQNKGPGIAEVKRFVMWDDTKCVDSDKSEDWTNTQLYFLSSIGTEYINRLAELVPKEVRRNDEILISQERSILDYQTLIKDGSSNHFVKINAKMRKSDEEMKSIFDFDFGKAKRRAFFDVMESKHFSIEYCSISGKTCKYMEFRKGGAKAERKSC